MSTLTMTVKDARDLSFTTRDEAVDVVIRLMKERDVLLEALEEFGTHYESCPQYPTYANPERHPPCNCGLDDAIKAVKETK